jgi:hypothetical protein
MPAFRTNALRQNTSPLVGPNDSGMTRPMALCVEIDDELQVDCPDPGRALLMASVRLRRMLGCTSISAHLGVKRRQ